MALGLVPSIRAKQAMGIRTCLPRTETLWPFLLVDRVASTMRLPPSSQAHSVSFLASKFDAGDQSGGLRLNSGCGAVDRARPRSVERELCGWGSILMAVAKVVASVILVT